MKRTIAYLAIGAIFVIVAGALVSTLVVDSIVRSNIEQIGDEMTGTRVTVDDVSISLFAGHGTISGLRVANPEGYKIENALVVNELFVKLDVFSLLSDEIVIEEIILTGVAVFMEQKIPGNNLASILHNIVRAEKEGTSADSDLFIQRFLLGKGSIDVYTRIHGERAARVELSSIELHDIGRDNGKQAVEQVIRDIVDQVLRQVMADVAKGEAIQLLDIIDNLF